MPNPSKPSRPRVSRKRLPPPGAPATADRLELMQTFIRIVDAGSLSSAAAQLGTTQPTVSRRLQALERSLGLRLLQRSTHAMKLTEDGARCYGRAKELLANWDLLESDLRGASDEPEGTLRVVVPHAFGQQMLVEPLTEYLGRHARVSVEWLLHDRAADFVADGIDCAIHLGEVHDPSVVALRVAEVPRIVVAAPSVLAGIPVPTHPDELARLPWLSLRSFYRNEISLTHVATGEVQPIVFQPRVSTDSLYAIRSAAVKGLGVCVASSWVLQEDLAKGRLVHLVPGWRAAPLPLYLLYPHARFHPARLRKFVELMREKIPTALAVATQRG
ncbi:LysR family transcriptional regulator [Corallococcus praedator]|uniref:LysR family transcriptional regulator n=1 Tax=Corallococcus praedator TaxID=2316724 RepID=A0ABX9QRR5_9BACT|nr:MULTISPECIES: LysR family transcriptional regulator [Corallococcus]RKH20540.1 LysR family transcriptional regulator [Corallococcus sp. CA047B]RKH36164.1 LysR family transcriptional regulator [Corallococcus sp. CA031C]RKI17000.1 LysR family transcriptional regulator [Corallococcus praedator]